MKKKPVSAVSKRGPQQSERRQAAEAAGMSRGQMWRAIMLASIPKDEFEALVESDEPPTVSEFVEIARERAGLPPNSKQGRRVKRCPHCHKDI